MVLYRVDSNIHGNCDINDIEVTSKPGPRQPSRHITAKDQKTPTGSELRTQQAVNLAKDFLSQMQALDHDHLLRPNNDEQRLDPQADGVAIEKHSASQTELEKQFGRVKSLENSLERCGLISAPESPSTADIGDARRMEPETALSICKSSSDSPQGLRWP